MVGLALGADVGDHDQDGQGLALGISLADASLAVTALLALDLEALAAGLQGVGLVVVVGG